MDIAESQCVAGSNNEANRYHLQLDACATCIFPSLLFFLFFVLWLNGYCKKLTMSTLLFKIVLVIHSPGSSRSLPTALKNPSGLLTVESHSSCEITVQVETCQSQNDNIQAGGSLPPSHLYSAPTVGSPFLARAYDTLRIWLGEKAHIGPATRFPCSPRPSPF